MLQTFSQQRKKKKISQNPKSGIFKKKKKKISQNPKSGIFKKKKKKTKKKKERFVPVSNSDMNSHNDKARESSWEVQRFSPVSSDGD